MVVPFPPGGAPDLVGRTLASRLADRLGQPFVVENRSGAGGNIAAEAVATSAPDGYTLFATSDGPLVINPNVYDKVPFDTLRDFAPITMTASIGLVLMACPSVPVTTVGELIALARSKTLSFASSGFGSSQHLAAEMFKASAKIDLIHVPYKGFGQAVVDAVACNVDLIFGAISTGLPYIRAASLRPIAVTIPRRHPRLPDTPTFGEAGHPTVVMDAYFGLLAPAGTPRAIIDKLHAEVVAILNEKETSERLGGAGLDLVGNSPEEFKARIKTDLEKFAKVAKSLGAKAQ
jgi:tripartite-type tricarboxylate transporter receptor subunit TctC